MVFYCILQYFVAKSFFCNLRCFVAKSVLVRFTRFCVEKNLAKIFARGEKMTNMRYGVAWYCIVDFGARAVSRKTPTYFI